jgi:NitT/TauT family transport system permease protein
MTTIPSEMREAARSFVSIRGSLQTVELPFAAIGLLWNSIMSWSGGWFFLMAGEIFNVGSRDFRCPDWDRICKRLPTGNLHAVVLE